jgi:hypothetical protein
MLKESPALIGFVVALGIITIIVFLALIDEIVKTVKWISRRKKNGVRQVGHRRNRKVTG